MVLTKCKKFSFSSFHQSQIYCFKICASFLIHSFIHLLLHTFHVHAKKVPLSFPHSVPRQLCRQSMHYTEEAWEAWLFPQMQVALEEQAPKALYSES